MNRPTISLNLPSYLKSVSFLSNWQEMIFNKQNKFQKPRSLSSSEISSNSSHDKIFLNQIKESHQNNLEIFDKSLCHRNEKSNNIDKNDYLDTLVNIENDNLPKTCIKIRNQNKKSRKLTKLYLLYTILRNNRKEIFYLIIFFFLLMLNLYNFVKILRISSELDDLKFKINDLLLISKRVNDSDSKISENSQFSEFTNTIVSNIGLTVV